MHYAADPGRSFLPHDSQSVFSRLAGMNNERFARLPGSPYVGAKTLPLPLGIALDPVVVQTGFPDGDNLGVTSQSDESINVRLFAGTVIRVNTRGGKYVGKTFCDRQDLGKGFQVHRHAKRVGHAICSHGPGYTAEIGSQFGKIDVTV